jgi:hypothetical protein
VARGWESKSVEMQIEDREKPVPETNTHVNSVQQREIELLELSRKRLLTELDAVGEHGDHRFRTLKRRALAHVDAALAAAHATAHVINDSETEAAR